MRLDGEYLFDATPQAVWDAFMDVGHLQHCIPGCEELRLRGVDEWTATIKVGVAMVKGTYTGSVAIREKVEPTSYVIEVDGKGLPGWVRGVGQISLAPDGDSTRVTVRGEGQVGGTIAAVGQRLIAGVGRMMMDQFFRCMRTKLTGGT